LRAALSYSFYLISRDARPWSVASFFPGRFRILLSSLPLSFVLCCCLIFCFRESCRRTSATLTICSKWLFLRGCRMFPTTSNWSYAWFLFPPREKVNSYSLSIVPFFLTPCPDGPYEFGPFPPRPFFKLFPPFEKFPLPSLALMGAPRVFFCGQLSSLVIGPLGRGPLVYLFSPSGPFNLGFYAVVSEAIHFRFP